MKMLLHINGEQGEIFEIEIQRRLYPDSLDYNDGNWVYANVKAKVSGFNASFGCNLRTDEFQEWETSIENFLLDKQTLPEFTTMEENINIEGERDTLGLVVWKFLLQTTEEYTCALRFVIKSSITEVENLRKDLKELLNQYPVVGEPNKK